MYLPHATCSACVLPGPPAGVDREVPSSAPRTLVTARRARGTRLDTTMAAPTRAGPTGPRPESSARPAIQEPAAMPTLNAETVKAADMVGAPPKRTARPVPM